jgi:NodT family efflux transporter outer membrane factor (OMF) lipoprotein
MRGARTVHFGLRAFLLVAPLLASACVVGPNYKRPALPATAGYGAAATTPTAAAGAPTLVAGQDVPAQWWRVFHCAKLDALVARALSDSPNVEAAKAALRQAHDLVRAQQGEGYPTVSASLQPSRAHTAYTLSSPLQNNSETYSLTTTQVSVAYTPDLFGATRRAVESLAAQADQQRFELEAARLTLASNLVQAALQDALLRAEIDATRSVIADQTQVLSALQAQLRLGDVSRGDLAAQEAVLAQARAALPALDKAFRVNRDLIAALLGKTPAEGPEVAFQLSDFTLPASLPLSLPSALVRQRPDVRAAEANLHSASAQIGVARAARFPNLQIDANAGSEALRLFPEFTTATGFYDVAAALTQPVFQGGELRYKERAARAAYDQALAQYRQALVTAFQNTADTLHALWTDVDAEKADAAAEAASQNSLAIARRQLQLGDVSRAAVLAVEVAEVQTRLTALQAQANRYQDAVALFQALGGGWWTAPGGGG